MFGRSGPVLVLVVLLGMMALYSASEPVRNKGRKSDSEPRKPLQQRLRVVVGKNDASVKGADQKKRMYIETRNHLHVLHNRTTNYIFCLLALASVSAKSSVQAPCYGQTYVGTCKNHGDCNSTCKQQKKGTGQCMENNWWGYPYYGYGNRKSCLCTCTTSGR